MGIASTADTLVILLSCGLTRSGHFGGPPIPWPHSGLTCSIYTADFPLAVPTLLPLRASLANEACFAPAQPYGPPPPQDSLTNDWGELVQNYPTNLGPEMCVVYYPEFLQVAATHRVTEVT